MTILCRITQNKKILFYYKMSIAFKIFKILCVTYKKERNRINAYFISHICSYY